jgi:hypothetical protein
MRHTVTKIDFISQWPGYSVKSWVNVQGDLFLTPAVFSRILQRVFDNALKNTSTRSAHASVWQAHALVTAVSRHCKQQIYAKNSICHKQYAIFGSYRRSMYVRNESIWQVFISNSCYTATGCSGKLLYGIFMHTCWISGTTQITKRHENIKESRIWG